MKPRVLIVDDDEAITQQLFWTLSDEYDVVTANDMQTAVRRATIYEPTVSIVD
jgi:DNA-binding response OmpR family regulator